MKLVVTIRRDADSGWIVETTSDITGPLFDRLTLGRSQTGLPVPDPSLQARWTGKPHATMCQGDIDASVTPVLNNLLTNDTTEDEIATFGAYLEEVALGANFQKALDASADGDSIDIELRIACADHQLHRLPWEMLHHSGAPIISLGSRRVSLYRAIASDVTDSVDADAVLPRPLQVLFVVGRQIDQMLRPWAELMALLRHLQVPTGGNDELRSADLELVFLGEATVDEIQAAIAKRSPAIVHIAAHGQVTADGQETTLLLSDREDPADPASKKTAEPYPCSATRLLTLLGHEGRLPPVVVLNACHTADVQTSSDRAQAVGAHPSFAASLVAGGIRVAVGMCGEVADRACQIFTVQFYRALVEGKSLTQAAAHGRRAALIAYPDHASSVEWARPTLFLAEGVSDTLQLGPSMPSLTEAAREFKRNGFPEMLCDRYEFLLVYQELLDLLANGGSRSPVVAISVADESGGVGKTRILEELAARSLADDFIPVLLRAEDNAPSHPLTFAVCLADAMRQSQEILHRAIGVAPPAPSSSSNSHRLAAREANLGDDASARKLRAYLARPENLPADMQLDEIRDSIAADFSELLSAASATTKREHRLLVLLDDLHEYGDLAANIVRATTPLGFATTGAPIPLLFTYMTSGGDGLGKKLKTELTRMRDIRTVDLNPFEDEEELGMVCRQLLLSGYRKVFTSCPGDQSRIEEGMRLLKAHLDGRPRNFDSDMIRSIVVTLSAVRILVEADYETVLRKSI